MACDCAAAALPLLPPIELEQGTWKMLAFLGDETVFVARGGTAAAVAAALILIPGGFSHCQQRQHQHQHQHQHQQLILQPFFRLPLQSLPLL